MPALSQLFLSTPTGTRVVRDVTTCADLYKAAFSTPTSAFYLSSASRIVQDDDTLLADLGIAEECTIHVQGKLLGGGKKRKKKTYTKPKKIKHKHKTVKLAVLKYYKIGADGTVERLRKECPADTCGAGVFMASHSDRVYCGKCGLTYVES